MKIAITGASGQVGKLLIPELQKAGHELLLIGRNTIKLRTLYPGILSCNYEQLPKHLQFFDTLIHLAVLNNDKQLNIEEFRKINVDFAVNIFKIAIRCSVKKFLFISSIHALDHKNISNYALSKRNAVGFLKTINDGSLEIIYLPYVHGSYYVGRLSFLNKIPIFISVAFFKLLAAVKPTVHISKFINRITSSERTGELESIISDGQSGNAVFHFFKRSVDLGFAVSVLLLFWWVLILTWLAINIGSPGPSIFAQRRVGQHGANFTCFKFRSMKLNTVEVGTHDVSVSAVTKVGGFLRRSKIDELPQVWNILKNEVSLVGPRPCLPIQTELLEQRAIRGVLEVKPGITGLAQIYGVDMSDPVRLAYQDQKYIALQCLALDTKIIFETIKGSGYGDRLKGKE